MTLILLYFTQPVNRQPRPTQGLSPRDQILKKFCLEKATAIFLKFGPWYKPLAVHGCHPKKEGHLPILSYSPPICSSRSRLSEIFHCTESEGLQWLDVIDGCARVTSEDARPCRKMKPCMCFCISCIDRPISLCMEKYMGSKNRLHRTLLLTMCTRVEWVDS